MSEEKNTKSEVALREEKVLEFWRENKIFEKSLEQTENKEEFVFYDGPVTANSKPVLHTMVPFSFKDIIPRYKTMQGFHVRRKGGWDTHGLPVELQVEKKLGLNSKKAIEEYGIAKFNKDCRESVWEYVELWKNFTNRMGYWADQKNAYATYDNNYIESVWNVVKEINKQKLLYKDYKVVPWCPRCGTALSSHELAQGYEEVKDLSVYAKFKILGVENGYFLAWTTTPWTLPGNVALAVGKDIDYVEAKVGEEVLVLAKERLSALPEGYEIIVEHKGSEMVGMQYEPLFPYLKEQVESRGEPTEKAFQVYATDFVNTTDGTGIVHIAVMYGQDDFELGNKVGLPKHHLVSLEGKFVEGTGFLTGRFVKEVDENGKPTLAVDIIDDLKKRNLFFKQENYKHSYPHCWRCKTALVYYARDSWYIRMSDPKIKKELISENKKINWEPEHTRDGRFGEWLREIKDWAVSRERYWGTPLPVWICEKCEKKHVVGSLEDLKNLTPKSGNKYFVMRHGEAENNAKNIYSSDRNINHLTEMGRADVLKTAHSIVGKKITKIYCSPFLRTRETAEIVAEYIGFPKEQIVYDDRLRELEFGEFSGRPTHDYWDFMKGKVWEFDTKVPCGESFQDGKDRFGDFLYEINGQNNNEQILIISHGLSVEIIPAIIEGADKNRSLEIFHSHIKNKQAALHREHEFVPLPHNEHYELDFHRPYIDTVKLKCDCGGTAVRTREVMDVWFDSGCMPFAQDHYPFNIELKRSWYGAVSKKFKEILYPADFISEAIDQTRGWFYTLHAVGVLMGRGRAYKNVICLGHLLDAKGKKMSKSLGNIIDPWEVMDKYGVDTLRLWMYSVNQPGESKNFDEKTVALIQQQVFGLLYNVLAFYELYPAPEQAQGGASRDKIKSSHVLDLWILARLDELVKLSTENLDNFKLLEPTRGIRDFIGDLSTWYLRRSRERIKEGNREARETLYFVLKTLAKVMAPFAPFAAEDIWLKLQNEKDADSVHLSLWPKADKVNSNILKNMKITGEIVSLGLEARKKEKIQARQPLSKLEVKDLDLDSEYVELIKDELNVKEVVAGGEFKLITLLTHELTEEGNYRELLRAVQDMRKKMGLTPSEVVTLTIQTGDAGKNLIQKFEVDMKKVVLASSVDFKDTDGEEIKIGELVLKIEIKK